MNFPRDYAASAASLLAQRDDGARVRPVDRAQGVAVVANAIAERARRRRQRRLLGIVGSFSAAAAVALLAGWFGARHASSHVAGLCSAPACASGVAAVEPGRVSGRPFEPGQSLVAGQGRPTVIELGPVTRIGLDEMSELVYRQGDSTKRFRLLKGAAHLRVEKLLSGQRFLVETPDAEVEVRGTVFDVSLKDADCVSPKTRVHVDQGVVEVRFRGQTARIRAGESWPAECDTVREPESRVAPAQVTSAPSSVKGVRALPHDSIEKRATSKFDAPSSQSSEPLAPGAVSTLSEQNDLYAAAVAARRAGRQAEAAAGFERVLARFPNGPLAESAALESFRTSLKSDPAHAKDHARRYLARYPNGLGGSEARAVLQGP